MNLPQLSPPIERKAVGSLSRDAGPTQGSVQSSPDAGANHGVVPSDVQDCYSLRGLAQNICLAGY